MVKKINALINAVSKNKYALISIFSYLEYICLYFLSLSGSIEIFCEICSCSRGGHGQDYCYSYYMSANR